MSVVDDIRRDPYLLAIIGPVVLVLVVLVTLWWLEVAG